MSQNDSQYTLGGSKINSQGQGHTTYEQHTLGTQPQVDRQTLLKLLKQGGQIPADHPLREQLTKMQLQGYNFSTEPDGLQYEKPMKQSGNARFQMYNREIVRNDMIQKRQNYYQNLSKQRRAVTGQKQRPGVVKGLASPRSKTNKLYQNQYNLEQFKQTPQTTRNFDHQKLNTLNEQMMQTINVSSARRSKQNKTMVGKKTRNEMVFKPQRLVLAGQINAPKYSFPTAVHRNRMGISPLKSNRSLSSGRSRKATSPRSDKSLNSPKATLMSSPLHTLQDKQLEKSNNCLNSATTTPACTDYSPNKKMIEKKSKGFAETRTVKFYKHQQTQKEIEIRPHSYEDPNLRGLKVKRQGTFNKAQRFQNHEKTALVSASGAHKKIKIMTRAEFMLKTANFGASVRTLNSDRSQSKKRTKSKVESESHGNTETQATQQAEPSIRSGEKRRPRTEHGKRRFLTQRRNTSNNIYMNTQVFNGQSGITIDTGADQDGFAALKGGIEMPRAQSVTHASMRRNQTYATRPSSKGVYQPALNQNYLERQMTSTLTPRVLPNALSTTLGCFSSSKRLLLLEKAGPGPADYKTGVDSCVLQPHKQPTICRAKRFVEPRQAASPEAGLYDTSSSVSLLKKKTPRASIPKAERTISPHLFHAHAAHAYTKGIVLK